jgi:hypothetical protein
VQTRRICRRPTRTPHSAAGQCPRRRAARQR